MKFFWLFFMAVALPGSLLAGTEFSDARELYYRGVDGDRSATKQSTAMLEKLAAASSADPLITVYLASNRLLESGRTFALWTKNRLAKEGIVGLDKAVKLASDDVEVRFVRAMSTRGLPAFFDREKQSEEDLAWLAVRVTSAVEAGTLQKRFAAAALYYHGLVREKYGDREGAMAAWKSAVAIAPESRAGIAASARLKVKER